MADKKLCLPDAAGLSEKGDGRLFSPIPERTFGPILQVLRPHVPRVGRALEIASGTGQHIVGFAAEFPEVIWQPSDIVEKRIESISAWREGAEGQIEPPIYLDATEWAEGLGKFDLIFMANLHHLISDEASTRILHNCSNALNPGGKLVIYGPFLDHGEYRSEGDRAFHTRLRAEDPEIGYKDVTWMIKTGEDEGLTYRERHEMPSNNLSFVFIRDGK